MARHNELGKWGEDMAEAYLAEKGYILLERDWHHGHFDVDLIVRSADRMIVAFVEVKTRTSAELTSPDEAVTPKKMRNLGLSADAYVKMHDLSEEIRFDIVSVVGDGRCQPQIEHTEDAFNPMLL